jgi:uncharacterized Zn finger protein
MNKVEFRYTLTENPILKEISVSEIDALINQFPYAANLYILKAIVLHEQEDVDFDSALQQAAARTISRSRLRFLIEGLPKLEFDFEKVQNAEGIEVEYFEGPEVEMQAENNISDEKEELISESILNESENEIQAEEVESTGPGKEENQESVTPRKNDFTFSLVKVGKAKTVSNPKSSTKSSPFSIENIAETKP